MTEPIDVTAKILEQIRDELRAMRGDIQANGKQLGDASTQGAPPLRSPSS